MINKILYVKNSHASTDDAWALKLCVPCWSLPIEILSAALCPFMRIHYLSLILIAVINTCNTWAWVQVMSLQTESIINSTVADRQFRYLTTRHFRDKLFSILDVVQRQCSSWSLELSRLFVCDCLSIIPRIEGHGSLGDNHTSNTT